MNKYFKLLLYGSLIFLAFALVKSDYLVVPTIYRPISLVVSFVLVMIGFVFDARGWRDILRKNGYDVNLTDAYTSSGLSIFTKYIPGKIWSVLGRSTYIAQRYKLKNTATFTASLQAQLLSLWTAPLVAILCLVGFEIDISTIKYWLLSLLIFWFVLSIMLFHKGFFKLSSIILTKILKKEVNLPNVNDKEKLKTIPNFIGQWGFWSLGFFFLIHSIDINALPFNSGFSFALGGSLGIIAIFAPGGIGIREGVLVGYLTMLGLDLKTATTISVTSRLWYLVGEFLFFISAFTLKKLLPK